MAPDIGDIIKKVGSDLNKYGEHSYRVTGWLKALPDLVKPADDAPWQDRFNYDLWLEDEESGNGRHGPDKKRLVWCVREEAEYVTGAGISGVIWRVADCEVIGRVEWSEDLIQNDRDHAIRLVGERVI